MWTNLKQAIDLVIKTNDNQEITGAILNNTLKTIVDTVGANATYAGIATPSTNPGTPDGPVFYFATGAGTYSNFGGAVLARGINILHYNNNSWLPTHIDVVGDIDNEPTQNSNNLVKSGGVYDAINTVLEVALSALDTIAEADDVPIRNSQNLVRSGGVYQAIHDNALPTLDYGNADFGFSDSEGNVIALFAGGHFRTKFFDSSKHFVNGYAYEGEKIDVKKYQFNYEHIYTETNSSDSSNQGAACFGKYLFQFHNTNDTVDIFNLETGVKVQTIILTSSSSYHCNCANFGREYYAQGDLFPLLYVSQEDSSQHKCLVYRVSGSEGSWTISLVQTITFPIPSNTFMWYPNCMIDTQNEKLIIVGLGNYPWSRNNDNIIVYKIYELPKLIDGDVTINAEDAIKSFEIKNYPTCQGGFVHNNKIYQVFGMDTNATLSVIDIDTGKPISKVNIVAGGIPLEPESCFLYNDCIWVNFLNGYLYKLNF